MAAPQSDRDDTEPRPRRPTPPQPPRLGGILLGQLVLGGTRSPRREPVRPAPE
ncbi:hypothetical protein [Nocardia arizonensis]|uniref:hypothetical protein n=1 Tax=Nocardia arizonensis TaxID=1141647 RepID=UPI000AFFC1BF|nr:hypothetical protein [Nocardia arizonensis]